MCKTETVTIVFTYFLLTSGSIDQTAVIFGIVCIWVDVFGVTVHCRYFYRRGASLSVLSDLLINSAGLQEVNKGLYYYQSQTLIVADLLKLTSVPLAYSVSTGCPETHPVQNIKTHPAQIHQNVLLTNRRSSHRCVTTFNFFEASLYFQSTCSGFQLLLDELKWASIWCYRSNERRFYCRASFCCGQFVSSVFTS